MKPAHRNVPSALRLSERGREWRQCLDFEEVSDHFYVLGSECLQLNKFKQDPDLSRFETLSSFLMTV